MWLREEVSVQVWTVTLILVTGERVTIDVTGRSLWAQLRALARAHPGARLVSALRR